MAADKKVERDLDEDLFDFDPIMPLACEVEDEDADLDDIFAAFQAEEENPTGSLGTAGDSNSNANDYQEFAEEDEGDIYEEHAAEPVDATPLAANGAGETVATSVADSPAPALTPAQAAPSAPAHEPAVAGASTTSGPGAAPTSAAAGLRKLLPNTGGALSRSALWILLAAMSLNGLVAIVMVSSTGNLRNQMSDISTEVEDTIREIRSEYFQQQAMLYDQTTPSAAPNPENHPAFARALDEIKDGAYGAARQRLYSLLSVVDRLDPAIRQKVEARASYLIGHSWHLEALQRLEQEELGGNQ